MRSNAQKGALVFGVVFLLIGIWGLFVEDGMSMEADLDGGVMGLFPVNILHNLVHLAFGVWGIAAARSHPASRTYGRFGAIAYGLLAVLAFFTPTLFGLVPIGSHDIWLHALLALGLGWIGWGTREAAPATTRATTA